MNLVRRIVELWLLGRATSSDNAFFNDLLTRLVTVMALAIGAGIFGIILSVGILALFYIFLVGQGIQAVNALLILASLTLVVLLIIVQALRTHIDAIKRSSKRFMRHQSPFTEGISAVSGAFMDGFLKK